ncbi:MAG: TRAP transporter substrate-binding protein [Rhizobiales bacterium]|nr:TRAP transporter substrate-binding protein [Hyphomicrobiales bacterium]NRB14653.1 TRAP transporter substrate-binding protein [Hyphomicrobiales bacterium]
MDRRKFLRGAGVAAVGVTAATLTTPALAAGVKNLKMVTSWPKGFPGLGTGAQQFVDRVNLASDGAINIKLYGGGELVGALECHDAVQAGTADLYHSAEYYYQGKSKAFNFFTAVPFGFTANEMDAWIQHGGGQELWDEVSGGFNIKCLPCLNTGVQMGGWFTKEINSIEDFKGLKMRIPGLGGAVHAKLGGTPVTLPGSEIMPALQAGTIDATEWVGPWNDQAFGFYKVAKNAYFPGFHEPGSMLSLGFNKDVWEAFTPSEQALLTACALAVNNNVSAEYNAKSTAALENLVANHGVIYREFSDEIFVAMGEASKEVLAEVAATDAITKKVHDSFMAFRKDALVWSEYSDASYMRKRALVDF